jgi:hypothetical protein
LVDTACPSQNIEPLGLTGEIFISKNLAFGANAALTPLGEANDPTFRLWRARSDVT